MATYTDFLPAIEIKQEHAFFFFNEMSRALERPLGSHWTAALQASGTIIGTNSQTRFYASLDAFLVMSRSVPDIVQASWGADRGRFDMVAWLKTLTTPELQRREDFTAQFAPTFHAFTTLALSHERIATVHRQGVTGAIVQVTTWFGGSNSGSAIQRIPDAVGRPVPDGVDPATLPAGAFRQAVAIEPRWSDFSLGGTPLYDQVSAYLDETSKLVTEARRIAQTVHGGDSLSYPPVP
jgi:hypothetical protein